MEEDIGRSEVQQQGFRIFNLTMCRVFLRLSYKRHFSLFRAVISLKIGIYWMSNNAKKGPSESDIYGIVD